MGVDAQVVERRRPCWSQNVSANSATSTWGNLAKIPITVFHIRSPRGSL